MAADNYVIQFGHPGITQTQRRLITPLSVEHVSLCQQLGSGILGKAWTPFVTDCL